MEECGTELKPSDIARHMQHLTTSNQTCMKHPHHLYTCNGDPELEILS